jgi:post-segregation antitoxin (ccd killing protein)
MNFTVYLPDDLGAWAKTNDLKLSAMFRTAVEAERERRAELEAASDGMVAQAIEVNDHDGNPVLLRFTGKPVSETGGEVTVYLLDGGGVLAVWEEEFVEFDDVDEFAAWVSEPNRDNQGREAERILGEAVGELGGRRMVELS